MVPLGYRSIIYVLQAKRRYSRHRVCCEWDVRCIPHITIFRMEDHFGWIPFIILMGLDYRFKNPIMR